MLMFTVLRFISIYCNDFNYGLSNYLANINPSVLKQFVNLATELASEAPCNDLKQIFLKSHTQSSFDVGLFRFLLMYRLGLNFDHKVLESLKEELVALLEQTKIVENQCLFYSLEHIELKVLPGDLNSNYLNAYVHRFIYRMFSNHHDEFNREWILIQGAKYIWSVFNEEFISDNGLFKHYPMDKPEISRFIRMHNESRQLFVFIFNLTDLNFRAVYNNPFLVSEETVYKEIPVARIGVIA